MSSNTGCGVRIKSITMKEKGKWKLEAHNAGNKTSQSFIYINVLGMNKDYRVFSMKKMCYVF